MWRDGKCFNIINKSTSSSLSLGSSREQPLTRKRILGGSCPHSKAFSKPSERFEGSNLGRWGYFCWWHQRRWRGKDLGTWIAKVRGPAGIWGQLVLQINSAAKGKFHPQRSSPSRENLWFGWCSERASISPKLWICGGSEYWDKRAT